MTAMPSSNESQYHSGSTSRRESTERRWKHCKAVADGKKSSRGQRRQDLIGADDYSSDEREPGFYLSHSQVEEENRRLKEMLASIEKQLADSQKQLADSEKSKEVAHRSFKEEFHRANGMKRLILRQEAKGETFRTFFKLNQVLSEISDTLFGDVEIVGCGSAVRTMFEWLADPVNKRDSQYGSPWLRDFDFKVKTTDRKFRMLRDYLEALVIKNLGVIEGWEYAFAQVGEVSVKKNHVTGREFTYFVMLLHNKSIQRTIPVDVVLRTDEDAPLADDFDVNSPVITSKGIVSTGGSFVDVVCAIMNRRATPLFPPDSSRNNYAKLISELPRYMKMRSSGYQICGPSVPKLSWEEDAIMLSERALSVHLTGCRCTCPRALSLEVLIRYVTNGLPTNCHFCRGKLTKYVIAPVDKEETSVVKGNPFIFRMEQGQDAEYERRSQREMSTYRDVVAERKMCHPNADAIMIDGKPVDWETMKMLYAAIRGEPVGAAEPAAPAESADEFAREIFGSLRVNRISPDEVGRGGYGYGSRRYYDSYRDSHISS
jgi:hypothetical protein